jgi:hypothetical protein
MRLAALTFRAFFVPQIVSEKTALGFDHKV